MLHHAWFNSRRFDTTEIWFSFPVSIREIPDERYLSLYETRKWNVAETRGSVRTTKYESLETRSFLLSRFAALCKIIREKFTYTR